MPRNHRSALLLGALLLGILRGDPARADSVPTPANGNARAAAPVSAGPSSPGADPLSGAGLPYTSAAPASGTSQPQVAQLPNPALPALPSRSPDSAAPGALERPLETDTTSPLAPATLLPEGPAPLYQADWFAPLGYSGPSGIVPREEQTDNHFVPVEDRWRVGFPEWDRYGQGIPANQDVPYMPGSFLNPFRQSVLKGDYPIWGQHTFLNFTADFLSFFEPRQVPSQTTPFESTTNPNEENFFGRPGQLFDSQFLFLSFDLFHGDAAFKPPDWRIKLTPVVNFNYLAVQELGIVSPNVEDGTTRARTFITLQEYILETKLADSSPYYDFISMRIGSQPFTSDFRGFIFSDVNRAIRIFGTRNNGRDEFNIAYFRQQEKNTNAFLLNTFNDRKQDIFVANYYRQDFIFPGYTSQLSFLYDRDGPDFKFDANGFLVRPDPVGVFQPHEVDAFYLGWNGEGHINRINIAHAFYEVLGHDSLNPLANRPQNINAQMAALELSYDRDWVRFRSSGFFASGDKNINNSHATGFDSILDNPNFAGGGFSYFNRQQIPLQGVNLTQRLSLVPDLRSSKIQGQANFVNPGLLLANLGIDFELTPQLRSINNFNYLWFDHTSPLKQFTFQQHIRHAIGADLSTGLEYRPLLTNNIIILMGISALIPGGGFEDLYNNLGTPVRNPLLASFVQMNITF